MDFSAFLRLLSQITQSLLCSTITYAVKCKNRGVEELETLKAIWKKTEEEKNNLKTNPVHKFKFL